MGSPSALHPALSDVAEATSRLLAQAGCDAARGAWQPLSGGANNTVLLFRDGNRAIVVKRYQRELADGRDRLDAEVKFLRYAAQAAPGYTPDLLAVDAIAGLALLSYVGDDTADGDNVTIEAIRRAGAFLAALNAPAYRVVARDLPVASDAKFSVTAHIGLIEDRLQALVRQSEPTAATAARARGLLDTLHRRWETVRDALRQAIAAGDLRDSIGEGERIVSPSDFGLHNARFDADGRLRFFDFEYAGWDDPAKTLSDFFLQPRIPIALSWWQAFLDAGPSLPPEAIRRAQRLMPLFAVKWACIVLKSLIPANRARRLQIYPGASVDSLLDAQMTLAQSMLDKLHPAGA